jgi:glycosyltransferase involved in cell wall biosynthesis
MGCCNEDFFVNLETEKRSYMDKEIHLVYAGSISPDTRYEYKYFIPTAENIVKNKIHFHIYPSSPTEERFSEYRNLEKQERYFHFHKHAPYKLLIKEMSQYDFGVLFERDIRGDRFIEEKAKTGMATKLFSYMEAGIPSIVNSHIETAKNFVEMNGIGFSLRENDFDRLRNLINIFDLEKFKKTIKKMRRYWSADNQVVYLERFYDSVLNN